MIIIIIGYVRYIFVAFATFDNFFSVRYNSSMCLTNTPFTPVLSVSLDFALVFNFIKFKLVFKEIKCHLNVLLYRDNLAKLILENSTK